MTEFVNKLLNLQDNSVRIVEILQKSLIYAQKKKFS